MKRIFVLSFTFLLVGFSLTAQSVEKSGTLESENKASCVPTKECAAKMGMTLEQCKAMCKKSCSKTASADLSSDLDSNASPMCCSSIEACASKMGMTVEECKAKCKGQHGVSSETGETKVAAAFVSRDETTTPITPEAPKKVCAKSGKKCCASAKK